MKKNIKDILSTITPDTPIEEIIAYCDTVKDFELILANLPRTESKSIMLSDEIKNSTLKLVKTNNPGTADINASYIQKNLSVTYPQAAALVDWLKNN